MTANQTQRKSQKYRTGRGEIRSEFVEATLAFLGQFAILRAFFIGFVSQLIAYADCGKGIVVMTNKDYLSEMLISEVINTIAKHYNWPEYLRREKYDFKSNLTDEALLLGKYKLRDDFYFHITKENEKIYLRPMGQPKIMLLPKVKRRYFSRELNFEVEFSREDGDDSVELVLKQNQSSFKTKKIEDDVDQKEGIQGLFD